MEMEMVTTLLEVDMVMEMAMEILLEHLGM